MPKRHMYAVTSIQLLSLTLYTKPPSPFIHRQKNAFILLLKLQYIDGVIDSLSLLSVRSLKGSLSSRSQH